LTNGPWRTRGRERFTAPLTLALAERQHIMQTLAFTGGLIEGHGGAAALLAVKPSTLRDRMRKDGITRAAALLAGRTTVLPTDWTLRGVQTRHISEVLTMADWRIEGPGGAAALLTLKPSTLRTRMARLGIGRSDERAGRLCHRTGPDADG
jgi:transcriptional regulator with GAF, ATPase, and Fis domain